MRRLAQSTSTVVMLKVFLSSDHISAATGKTVAITISKAGGAFGNPNVGALNATEVSGGWYKFTLDTTDTNTLGVLVVTGTATACDASEQTFDVVNANTGGTLALPNVAAGSVGGLPTLDTGLVVKANATQWLGGTIPAVNVTGVPLVDLKYTLGTISPAAAGSVRADAVTGITASDIGAIKAKTDNLPGSPAATSDIPTANQNADALLDRAAGIETNRTLRQGLRLMLSAMCGKASGLATATAVYRDTNDTKDRITATVDANGNRTAVTLDAS